MCTRLKFLLAIVKPDNSLGQLTQFTTISSKGSPFPGYMYLYAQCKTGRQASFISTTLNHMITPLSHTERLLNCSL